MNEFSVANFGSNGNDDLGGQSFTPNIPGPDGTGSPGSATQVFIKSISIGYPTASTSGRARMIYVYSIELTDPDQIGQIDYLVAMSGTAAYTDGTGLFGTGSYQRTFGFGAGALLPGSKYYAYFDIDQNMRFKSSTPYSGGNAYDDDLTPLTTLCCQFQVALYD